MSKQADQTKDKEKTNLVAISPSRLNTLRSCSFLYYTKYNLKIPDTGNDGARRGSCLHDLFQWFDTTDEGKEAVEQSRSTTPFKVSDIKSFIESRANKYELKLLNIDRKSGKTNQQLVEEMIRFGIEKEFTGRESFQKELLAIEKAFDFIFEEPDFRIRGFIDKATVMPDDNLRMVDYKSSAKVFTKDEIANNIQALSYLMAAQRIWPDYNQYILDFFFLRFPDKAYQRVAYDQEASEGFKWFLHEISKEINSFNSLKAHSNFAANDPKRSWLCGRGQWVCPVRDPLDYYVLLEKDENGKEKIVESAFQIEKLSFPVDNQEIDHRHYSGCPIFNNRRKIKKILTQNE